MNYIAAAKIGHIEMLKAIFGEAKPEERRKSLDQMQPMPGPTPVAASDAPPLTPDIFDRLFTGPQD